MSLPDTIHTDRRANLLGSLWMVGAMAAFALEDAFLKGAAAELPVAEILLLMGVCGALVFAVLARFRGERLANRDVTSPPMLIRFVFEFIGRLFYVVALALTPLSSATAILQATPIVVVLGAALIFGETVGWRRWTAIIVGLIGVLIVLRPGAEAFSALSILAVVGMLGFAGRDLASRAAPASISTNVLGFYGFVTIAVAGGVFYLWEGRALVMPSPAAALSLLAVVTAGVLAYSALMKAMRTGQVSAVTPFRYSRLLFGVGLGVFVFDEKLDAWMVAGCVLIVASGLFILWRGTRKAA
ncbi:DMT family transporter [Labrenzia sp. CE80]|uniref:DMT family transporter n=1 Tax=Labrenzia sp. CE80 TaxID=1788986 RepID=UPI00257128D1|nr:DMT family transporter [Labrenzia sp. CE80]